MVTKTKTQRAKRKGVKSGGEAPCKRCAGVTLTPARNRQGQFVKKKRAK